MSKKEQILEYFKDINAAYNNSTMYDTLKHMLEDLEEVRHARWIERTKVYPDLLNDTTYNYECPECGYMDTHGANVEVPYCWHCGAKMDETEYEEPEINPCRGCEDYDGKGGCLSNGGCGERREDAETD